MHARYEWGAKDTIPEPDLEYSIACAIAGSTRACSSAPPSQSLLSTIRYGDDERPAPLECRAMQGNPARSLASKAVPQALLVRHRGGPALPRGEDDG
jgi:hypothetical protein